MFHGPWAQLNLELVIDPKLVIERRHIGPLLPFPLPLLLPFLPI